MPNRGRHVTALPGHIRKADAKAEPGTPVQVRQVNAFIVLPYVAGIHKHYRYLGNFAEARAYFEEERSRIGLDGLFGTEGYVVSILADGMVDEAREFASKKVFLLRRVSACGSYSIDLIVIVKPLYDRSTQLTDELKS